MLSIINSTISTLPMYYYSILLYKYYIYYKVVLVYNTYIRYCSSANAGVRSTRGPFYSVASSHISVFQLELKM